MAKKQKPTRSEQNKEVRTILNRYGVDTNSIQFATAGSSINLYGLLVKRDGAEFSTETLTTMLNELEKLGRINSQLTNWDLNNGVRKIHDPREQKKQGEQESS